MSGTEASERSWLLRLVRHAKSSWDDPSLEDIDRPLSDRGRRSAEALARHLAESGDPPDVVICSPAKRARQTLEAIRESLGPDAEIRIDPVVYEDGPDGLLAVLRDLAPRAWTVTVIGHNPTLREVALRLAAPDESADLVRLRVKFPTGALVSLVAPDRAQGLSTGGARLRGLWTPR
jgi:phosphohistidine phosphatase